MKTKNVTFMYKNKMKKRLVKATLRKMRREAAQEGFKVLSATAFKKCGKHEYHRQYVL